MLYMHCVHHVQESSPLYRLWAVCGTECWVVCEGLRSVACGPGRVRVLLSHDCNHAPSFVSPCSR